MKRPTIISVVNHKGGCLKTTLTANLAAGLARAGKRVLTIDLDAQQNLTTSLIGPTEYKEGVRSLYDAFIDESSIDDQIRHTPTDGLDIVPVTEDFAGADLSLVSVVGREFVLKNMLQKTEALKNYDLVLIDNPPSISLVVMNALVASDFFFVPCSAEYLPMVGLSLLSESIVRMKKIAPALSSLGVVLTLYSHNERICRQVEQMLRREIGDMLFETKVRVNTKAKAAPSVQKTIVDHEKSAKGRGTEDFGRLTEEFLQRLEGVKAPARRVANG